MKVIGHDQQKKFLSALVKSGNIPHALIFSGPEKIGKKTIALEFVKSIFCQNKNLANKICDNCYSCRAINDLVFPDLAYIASEEDGKEIKIDQIWSLTEKLSLKSYDNYYKIGIIDQAHLMNLYAQNALLKTLEEPKGKTVLILITAHPEMLLPTIRSRAQNLKFGAVAKQDIEKYLISLGASEETAKEITILSFGQIGRAIDFYQNPELKKEFLKNLDEIEALCSAEFSDRFNYAKKIVDDAETIEALMQKMEIWERFFRREMLIKIFSKKSKFSARSVTDLKNIVKSIEKLKYLISATNVNKRLALENFLLNL